ncbi:hypothetical protein IEQ34_013199 [Dendrobium chrysotoxum]|uniref:Uncharacterized protein n=1 Tax=Dendrobium chrysotoxum TaxID=161865 RepID=A0AAV7GQA9_DENCH|nr:hypothetical protein IEQ34_013199 [Dendrobium chrysotoxum]
MPGGVNVGARVGGKHHLGVVGERTVVHGFEKPQKLPHPFRRLPRRHVIPVVVGDVDDPPAVILLPPHSH